MIKRVEISRAFDHASMSVMCRQIPNQPRWKTTVLNVFPDGKKMLMLSCGRVLHWYGGMLVGWYRGRVVGWWAGRVVGWWGGRVVGWWCGGVVGWYCVTILCVSYDVLVG